MPGLNLLREALMRELADHVFTRRNAQPMTVGWSPERVDAILSTYSAAPEVSRSRTYAGLIKPIDFLGVTSADWRIREIMNNESRPLDLADIGKDPWGVGMAEDTPYLGVDISHRGRSRLVNRSHEGRHRTTGMGFSGAEEVPILLKGLSRPIPMLHPPEDIAPSLSDAPTPISRRIIEPDPNWGSWPGVVRNLVPVAHENRDALLNFSRRPGISRHVTYALPLLAALASQLRGQDAQPDA